MSQNSWLGSLSTQVETFTVDAIYQELKGRTPAIYPTNPDYAANVRQIVLSRMNVQEGDLSNHQLLDLISETRKFADKIRRSWKTVKGAPNFERKYKGYLNEEVEFRIRIPKKKRLPTQSGGVKKKKFGLKVKRLQTRKNGDMSHLNPRTLRRESAKILKNHRRDAIVHATKQTVGKGGGRVRHSDILIDRIKADKNYAAKVLKVMDKKELIKITPERFLALILDRDLSENDNFEIQKLMAEHGADIVPSRYAVRKVKRVCLDGIKVDYGNWEVIVDYPSLRRKTLNRFVTIKKNAEMLKKLSKEYGGHVQLIDYWKWGFDGLGEIPTSDMKTEKPTVPSKAGDNGEDTENDEASEDDKASEEEEEEVVETIVEEDSSSEEESPDTQENTNGKRDESSDDDTEEEKKLRPPEFNPKKMVVSQCVLIQVSAKAQGDKPERVIWRSRLANCSSACRPLRVCFQCETKAVVQREYKRIKGQIAKMEIFTPGKLQETVCSDPSCTNEHDFKCTCDAPNESRDNQQETVVAPEKQQETVISPKRARSPERRQKSHDRTNRSSSKDRRSSTKDKDFQEFSKIVTENMYGDDENQKSEFLI